MRQYYLLLGSLALFFLAVILHSSIPLFTYICLLGGILLFLLFFSLKFAPPPRSSRSPRTNRASAQRPKVATHHLSIPMTAQRAYATLSNAEFELFAAAVIIGGVRPNYSFVRHCGRAGDKGTDVLLKDHFGQRICVQAKRYKLSNKVEPRQVREFSTSIRLYRVEVRKNQEWLATR